MIIYKSFEVLLNKILLVNLVTITGVEIIGFPPESTFSIESLILEKNEIQIHGI